MKFPVLYKKTSTGADQFWEISTQDNVIVTRWGQLDGKIQETRDEIKEGKNVGKKNETSPRQQAQMEAESQWEKKLKKGYVKTLGDARAGKVDDIIEGGVSPMLAHKFSEQGHKIEYPAYVQPKFDGHRCVAMVVNGKASLWTRTRKPITGLPHIIKVLEAEYPGMTVTLDGELYNHDYKNNFEDLTSFIRNPEPKKGHEVVQYHIYDMVDMDRTFAQRHEDSLESAFDGKTLVGVETIKVTDEDELMLAFERFLEQGYEGAMVRNAAGKYVNKRSYDLQKIKEMDDDEFEVVGVEAGRGKMSNKAIFICTTTDGTSFRAKMKGSLSELEKYIKNPKLAIGKMLTVQYQGITNKEKVPRFPVGLRFRED